MASLTYLLYDAKNELPHGLSWAAALLSVFALSWLLCAKLLIGPYAKYRGLVSTWC